MVIGSGLIAKSLTKYYENKPDICIFASGVSNSGEVNFNEYQREFYLLRDTIKNYNNSKIIYFSSTSISTGKFTPYISHKLAIENFLLSNHPNSLILRLPIVVGAQSNKNQLIPYFVNKLDKKQPFTVFENCKRYLLDCEDLYKIVEYFKNKRPVSKVVNVQPTVPTNVLDLVLYLAKIRKVTDLEFNLGKKENNHYIDTRDFIEYEKLYRNNLNLDYKSILDKYFQI